LREYVLEYQCVGRDLLDVRFRLWLRDSTFNGNLGERFWSFINRGRGTHDTFYTDQSILTSIVASLCEISRCVNIQGESDSRS
jgi:hypothetical protein